jgi:hypothetical protein
MNNIIKEIMIMKYVVKYTNPNNIIYTGTYTYETHSKKELNEFLDRAKKYPGSYNIVSNEKVSETKK